MPTRSKNNVRLSTAVARYLERITNEKQSDRTIYTARATLERFKKTVATKGDPDPWVHLITDTDMDNYCYGPGGIAQNVKSISFNRYRSVLVNFFRYCEDLRWCDISPMKTIRPARADQPVSRLLLSASEMLQMLELAANPIERIALSLGMNTGLRGSDARELTVFDANLSSGVIQTEIRKTKKLDNKPITMELDSELRRYLDIYAEMCGFESRSELPNHYLLMPSYRNQAPRETLKYRIKPRPTKVHTKPWHFVHRPLAALGYPTKGEGYHTLRRSSARALFESLREGEGRDHALMIVRDFLNHSSITQTELYLGLSHERVLRDARLRGRSFLQDLATSEQQKHDSTIHSLRQKVGA